MQLIARLYGLAEMRDHDHVVLDVEVAYVLGLHAACQPLRTNRNFLRSVFENFCVEGPMHDGERHAGWFTSVPVVDYCIYSEGPDFVCAPAEVVPARTSRDWPFRVDYSVLHASHDGVFWEIGLKHMDGYFSTGLLSLFTLREMLPWES